jgi:NAD(P)-dependent dehydrogenase (short-subunit alcohol dehydrogenase family)
MTPATLAGQVALVTGGGRGIGRHIAVGLAERAASVAILARTRSEVEDVAAHIVAGGGCALAVPGDVSDRRDVEEAVISTERSLGAITLLVNNAGTCRAVGPLSEVDPDEWWREVEIHVRGAALTSHCVLRGMVERGRGRIINVYGNLGDRSGAAFCSAYAVAKASLLRLTEHAAVEAGTAGVTVFALHPGLVDTPLIAELATGEAGRRWLPRFSAIGPEEFLPAERAVEAVVAIATGRADALTGRLIQAWDDLDALIAEAAAIVERDLRALRISGL